MKVGSTELSGQVWLHAFLCHFACGAANGIDIEIYYVSTYAADMTQALREPKTSLHLISYAAGLRQLLDHLAPVSYQHVRSHSGDPWNELADRVCDLGGSGYIASFSECKVLKEWQSNP